MHEIFSSLSSSSLLSSMMTKWKFSVKQMTTLLFVIRVVVAGQRKKALPLLLSLPLLFAFNFMFACFSLLRMNTDKNKRTNRQIDKQTENLIKAQISNSESTWNDGMSYFGSPSSPSKIQTRRDETKSGRKMRLILPNGKQMQCSASHAIDSLNVCERIGQPGRWQTNQNKASKKA